MTIAQTREALAAALSAVDGVTVRAHRKDVAVPREGDGWVLWRGSSRGDGYAHLHRWAVVIVLPASETVADEWIESRLDDLDDAARAVLFVDSFQPATTPLGGQSNEALALVITGRSE
jgi:hypothetical protein